MATQAPFHITRPFQGVWQLSFRQQPGILGLVDLPFHFLRFQEHYEGPGHKGTVFTWAQYVAWYKAQRGSFSYAEDWSGFNFPGKILKPFRQGLFNPLTRREKAMLQALEGVQDGDYVIGSNEGDAETLKHELAHAFWYVDPEYRAQVEAILEGGNYSRQEAKLAEGQGYDKEVFRDEIQANAVEGWEELGPGKERTGKIREIFNEMQKIK